jgi:hypothetical protein
MSTKTYIFTMHTIERCVRVQENGSLRDLLSNETVAIEGELLHPIVKDICQGAHSLITVMESLIGEGINGKACCGEQGAGIVSTLDEGLDRSGGNQGSLKSFSHMHRKSRLVSFTLVLFPLFGSWQAQVMKLLFSSFCKFLTSQNALSVQ